MKKPNSIHLLIAAVLFFALRIILGGCTDMGITPAGASTLALFVATIYVWITYGGGWTAMLSIGLLGFTGIAPASTILANSFGNATSVICIGTLILCVALEENGVTALIANWFITRKFVNKRPYAFLFMFLLADLFVCYFMEATGVIIVFLALAKNILDSLGYTRQDKFAKAMYLGLLWISTVGNGATPIGHPVTLLMLNSLTGITGESVSWIAHMAVGIPLSLITLLITLGVFKFILRPDCSKFLNYDVMERRKEMKPLNKKGAITVATYICLVIAWLLPDLAAPFLPGVAEIFSSVGASLISLLGVAAVCGIRVKGEPVLRYESAIGKIQWPVVYLIACNFAFSASFSMESGGISVFLGELVSPLTSYLSAGLLAAVFLAFVLYSTNFVANIVAGTIGIVVCVPALLETSSISYVTAFGVLVAMLCNMGVATLGGSGFVALAQKDGYITSGETFKYSMITITLMYISVLVIAWPLSRFIFF